MKTVSQKQTSLLAYKTPNTNPQYNQPIAQIKPLVIKQTQNNYLDANTLAVLQQKRNQQIKQEQKSRISNFNQTTKLNASKIWQQKNKKIDQSRKIKQQMLIKQNQLKSKYSLKSKQIQQKPKRIQVQSQRVEWKKGKDANQKPLQEIIIEKNERQQRQRFRKKQRSVQKSEIAHPNYREQLQSGSQSQFDSEVQQKTLEEALMRFSKLRIILEKNKGK